MSEFSVKRKRDGPTPPPELAGDDDVDDVNDALQAAVVVEQRPYVPNAYERMPDWATAQTRADTLDALFRGTLIEAGLWRLLFQSAPRQRGTHACSPTTGRPIEAWAIDWAVDRIVFRFARPSRLPEGGLAHAVRTLAPLNIATAGGRVFPVQRDGHLCGTHSLNAVARATLLNPASIYETMAVMREHIDADQPYGLYAQREELIVAALREGVVLGSVVLSDLTQLEMMTDRVELPTDANRTFELAATAAGGVILHFASGGGEGGHFVAVVPLVDGWWSVYDTAQITASKESLGEALRVAIEQRVPPGGYVDLQMREVVALVPIVRASSPLAEQWFRSTLRNMEAREIGGRTHLHAPVCTPIAMSAASIAYNALPRALALNSGINLFTCFTAQCKFETEMNEKAQELAACLGHRTAPGKYSLYWAPGASAAQRERLLEVPTHLAQLGSLLRSWIGLLFVPSTLLPNREWLRYVAVHVVARQLRTALAVQGPSVQLYKLAAAVAALAFTWHHAAGEVSDTIRSKYVAVDDLYQIAHNELSLIEVFGDAGSDSRFGVRAARDLESELRKPNYLGKARIDRALWLLHNARTCGVVLPLLPTALDALDSGTLDSGAAGGDAVVALDRLRKVAFALPRLEQIRALEQLATLQTELECTNAPAPPTSAQRAEIAVRSRRLVWAPTFRQMLQSEVSPYVRWLIVGLCLPVAYASPAPSAAELSAAADAEVDTRPNFLEQAFVRTSADEMFSSVFDAEHAAHNIDPELPVSTRFKLVSEDADPTQIDEYRVDDTTFMGVRALCEHTLGTFKRRRLEPAAVPPAELE